MPVKKIKVIIDTNLWISFAYNSFHSPLNKLLLEESIEIIGSDELIQELREVLHRPKFRKTISTVKIERLLSLFAQAILLVKPAIKNKVASDPKDDLLFDIAMAAKADYLITGDKNY